jgi:hypothetical protein
MAALVLLKIFSAQTHHLVSLNSNLSYAAPTEEKIQPRGKIGFAPVDSLYSESLGTCQKYQKANSREPIWDLGLQRIYI